MSKQPEKSKANGGEKERQTLVIPLNCCHLAEARRNTWEITLPDDARPEDLLDHSALGPIARQLTLRDMIYAQPRDGSWLAIYRVIQCDSTRAQLALLQRFELPPSVDTDDADPPGHKITRDDVLGWHIVRLADGVLMGSQIDNPDLRNREMCRRFVKDHATVRAPRGN